MIVFNVCILNNKQILIIKTLSKSNYTFVYSSYVLLILFILFYPLNPTEPPSFFVILSIRHNPSPLYPLNPSQPPFILRYPINPSQPPFILSFQSVLLLAPVSSFYHFNPYFSYKYHAFFILSILLTPSPLYSFLSCLSSLLLAPVLSYESVLAPVSSSLFSQSVLGSVSILFFKSILLLAHVYSYFLYFSSVLLLAPFFYPFNPSSSQPPFKFFVCSF